jgi:hypothetical protein
MPAATYVSFVVRSHLRRLAPTPDVELKALKHAIGEIGAIGRNLNQIAHIANHSGLHAPPTGILVEFFPKHSLRGDLRNTPSATSPLTRSAPLSASGVPNRAPVLTRWPPGWISANRTPVLVLQPSMSSARPAMACRHTALREIQRKLDIVSAAMARSESVGKVTSSVA